MSRPMTTSPIRNGVATITGDQRPKPSRKLTAKSKDSARNRIQPRQTMWKVTSTPTTTGSFGQAAGLIRLQIRSQHSPRPCRAPQATKVQEAPCQRPPKSMVIKMLRQVLNRPPRPPPSGM